jgi:hypothetical protein
MGAKCPSEETGSSSVRQPQTALIRDRLSWSPRTGYWLVG